MLNDSFERVVLMFYRILTLLVNNITVLVDFEALSEAKQTLEQMLAELTELIGQWDTVYKGRVQDREFKEQELIKLLAKILAALQSVAYRTNNKILEELVKITDTELKEMKATNLIQTAKEIIAHANTYKLDLIKYKIEQIEIDNTTAQKDAYKDSVDQTSETYSGKTAEMIAIGKKISEIRYFLRHDMDKIVKTLEQSNPVFVSEYRSCRKIKNFGVRHKEKKAPSDPPANPSTPNP